MTTPQKQGLYDPQFEHENCGIGLIVDMKGRKSHDIVRGALEICVNLDHRGGCGCDPITGDGAGISNIAAGNIVGLDLSSISNGSRRIRLPAAF